MANRVGYKTIKGYLSGIQFHLSINGSPIRIADMSPLFYTLRGIRRRQGNHFRRLRRSPITINMLSTLHAASGRYTSSRQDSFMWCAASSIAFYGLLRCSEYTASSARFFDASVTLCFSDISFNEAGNIMSIRIKASKTDPFRVGCSIRIGASARSTCAIRAMQRYIAGITAQAGPLFRFSSGEYLTRHHMSQFLAASFPGRMDISTHSFRIGGASAAASAGCSDHQIQALGRWRSDAFLVYLRYSEQDILQLSSALSSARPLSRLWDTTSLSTSTL